MGSVYRVSGPNIIHEAFEDEVIVLNMNNGNYFSLSKTSADIWKLIGPGATIQSIVRGIKQRYEGVDSEIEKAVCEFVKQLEQENLIAALEEGDSGGNQSLVEIISPEERLMFQIPTLQKFSDMQEMLLLDPIHDVDETGWPGLPRVSQNQKEIV